MASDTRVRAIIRLKLESQLLPRTAAGRVWAGPGNNEVCSACDDPVRKTQTVYEWDADGVKVTMHVRCYEIWNTVRQRRPLRRGGRS
jgi:hypothetical protein